MNKSDKKIDETVKAKINPKVNPSPTKAILSKDAVKKNIKK
jgi:hypothetical protein